MARIPKWKGSTYCAAVIGATIVLCAIFFGYFTRTKTFSLTYFPDDTYEPARHFPLVDGQGQPRVVMVRESGQIECFDIFYSRKLKELLEANPTRRVAITYRVRYRLHPVWIETVDVAGLGIEPRHKSILRQRIIPKR